MTSGGEIGREKGQHAVFIGGFALKITVNNVGVHGHGIGVEIGVGVQQLCLLGTVRIDEQGRKERCCPSGG